VEAPVERGPTLVILIELPQLLEDLRDLIEVLGRDFLGRQAGRQRLQVRADEEILEQPRVLRADHHRAAMQLARDEALSLELAEGLTNRRRAHFKAFRQVTLPQYVAWRQLSGVDQLAYALGDHVALA